MLIWLGFGLGIAYGAVGYLAAEDETRMIVKLPIVTAWIGVGVLNLIEWRRHFKPAQGA